MHPRLGVSTRARLGVQDGFSTARAVAPEDALRVFDALIDISPQLVDDDASTV